MRGGAGGSLPGLALVLLVGGLAGCASQEAMRAYVPAYCHGAAAPFLTFAIQQENMPGFMAPILADALDGALRRAGLSPAAADGADVTMVVRFSMIARQPGPERVAGSADAFGDRVAPGVITRFVAHVDLELVDNRDGNPIWRGTMDRPHAIVGAETFHDDRAILRLATTLDRMLRNMTVPCRD
jgi:hypothetical protein